MAQQAPKFSPVKHDDWVAGDYCPTAMLVPGWKELAQRLNVTFAEYRDRDLGQAIFVQLKTASGLQFGIEALPEAPTDFEYIRIMTLVHDNLTNDMEEILEATGIKSTELRWVNDLIKFKPHEVWRQDDNGNQFLVETKPCKADANQLSELLTARGHKQMYWVKAAK